MKKNLYILLTLLMIFSVPCFGHVQYVHQYMVKQAYYLLKSQGMIIPKIEEHLGNNETGNGAFNPGGLIVIGAHLEDEEEIVYNLGFPDPFDWLTSNTHFWEADFGDNSVFVLGPLTYTNAYQKALKYYYGGWELQVPYPANGIIEAYEAPSNLAEYYKTGNIYYKGYYNMATGEFINRGYWTTSSETFRDRIVWELLGRLSHLLGDMSVPAHAHNDAHVLPDEYEDVYMPSSYTWYDYHDALYAGGYIDVTQKSNPIKYLFYTTNQVADYFPSNALTGYNGDNTNYLNDPFSQYPELNGIINSMNTQIGGPPTDVNGAQIANWSFTTAIRTLAGLLHLFAVEAELQIVPADLIVSPSTYNVGTVKGYSQISNSFTITASNCPLSGTVTTSNPFFDLDAPTYRTYEYSLNFWLDEGESFTINYNGLAPQYAGPFTETFTITTNIGLTKTYSIVGEVAVPDFCFAETQMMALSPEEQLFDKEFSDFFVSIDSLDSKSRDNLTLKEKIAFAYRLLGADHKVPVSEVCKTIIELYTETEMGIAFYALGILWEASLSDEEKEFTFEDMKVYLNELADKKGKYHIYGYAELLLGILEIDDSDIRFDKIDTDYKYENLKEVALFQKFIHQYIYKEDIDKAKKTSDKLDRKYPSSKYAYQAHLIMEDDGYAMEGLKKLIEENNIKLPKQGLFGQQIISQVPTEYMLYQNYPNPFNPSTIIKYQVPENTVVKINIYNSMGQLVKSLVNDIKSAGTYSIEWYGDNDYGSNAASGVYFCRLVTNKSVFTNKMILVR